MVCWASGFNKNQTPKNKTPANTSMNPKELNYRQMPNATKADLQHIPGDFGWPVIGKTFSFFADFDQAMYSHVAKYGPVSKISFGWQNGVLALGPDVAKALFLDSNQNFSTEMGSKIPTGEWIGGGLLFRDFDEHKQHRRIFQTAFKADAMRGYVETTNQVIDQGLSVWGDKSQLTFVPFIKELLMNINAKVFYGIDNLGGIEAKKLSEAFYYLIEKGTMAIFKINLPPFNYYYGLKGKNYIDQYSRSIINSRRQGNGNDFISYLVKEKKEDGSYFSDQDLIDHSRFLFFAAFDTTTTLLSHLVMYLAIDQNLQEEFREECRALGKEQLEYDDLDKMTKIDRALHEVLRLHPSAPVLMRRSIRECTLGGIRIPENTIIFHLPSYNHRMSEWWDAPLKFDPDRFSPEREEHKRHGFSYIPFGGGAHKCIGMHFAKQNVKMFMFQLLMKYRFYAPENYKLNSSTIPMPKPNKNLPLTVVAI